MGGKGRREVGLLVPCCLIDEWSRYLIEEKLNKQVISPLILLTMLLNGSVCGGGGKDNPFLKQNIELSDHLTIDHLYCLSRQEVMFEKWLLRDDFTSISLLSCLDCI